MISLITIKASWQLLYSEIWTWLIVSEMLSRSPIVLITMTLMSEVPVPGLTSLPWSWRLLPDSSGYRCAAGWAVGACLVLCGTRQRDAAGCLRVCLRSSPSGHGRRSLLERVAISALFTSFVTSELAVGIVRSWRDFASLFEPFFVRWVPSWRM